MNSEELEKSLVTEFENYLETFLAEMRQETVDFQGRIEAEFEKQRSEMDAAFRAFAARFDKERKFDAGFTGSVAEHLRLARDEGARVAANAMVEAENLGQSPLTAVATTVAPPQYDAIKDAVEEISTRDSQSAILKSLVHHAESFAGRGAFFIVKSDHFAGWKAFGADAEAEAAIKDIHFAVQDDTILGAAARGKSTVESSGEQHPGDASFLDPLRFGRPAKMFAIPLVARGRGVAVLYVDGGEAADSSVNGGALETLVRVAGLTVELLASMQSAKAENRSVASADFENVVSQPDQIPPAPVEPEQELPSYVETVPEYIPDTIHSEPFPTSTGMEMVEPQVERDPVSYTSGSGTPFTSNPFESEAPASGDPGMGTPSSESPFAAPQTADPFAAEPYADHGQGAAGGWAASDVSSGTGSGGIEDKVSSAESITATAGEIVFESEPARAKPEIASPFGQPADQFEPAGVASSGGFTHQATPEPSVIEAPVVQAVQPRLSERNVDLPIEVPEEERRIHNDARRFARLLVSEIKLYNEKKVVEGREASDLYERLREAIDRSREMYDKRVQPPVAAKFDYFHYELVNSLADGQPDRLGSSYPGASV